jgi:hypothetical protein
MMIGVMCACMPSVAYSYRHIEALQGIRQKLSPKVSALIPSSIFKSRQTTLPVVQITGKSTSSAATDGTKESKSYYQLADYPASDKSMVSAV